jgi:NMD protein affecting ribosome stability and mRNA decay
MSGKQQQTGFHPIRHDRLLQEREHDAYKAKGKLKEPSVCKQCGAVYHQGRWQWIAAPEGAHADTCPACHRIHDHYPAGYLTLKGSFLQEHRDEIMNLIFNEEKRQRADHPMKRIMDIETKGDEVVVTTTDIHLARSMGDALHHAYQGKLEYHYNEAQNLLRVEWVH